MVGLGPALVSIDHHGWGRRLRRHNQILLCREYRRITAGAKHRRPPSKPHVSACSLELDPRRHRPRLSKVEKMGQQELSKYFLLPEKAVADSMLRIWASDSLR